MCKSVLLTACFVFFSAMTQAANNPLSVHVLNTTTGLPSSGVEVILEVQQASGWKELARKTTNAQGRIPVLYPEAGALPKGIYRVRFLTGDWFARQHQPSFFPEIPVIFAANDDLPHYHIPLLLSPYGYSTYRGN